MQVQVFEWIREDGWILFPELLMFASNTSGAARSIGQRIFLKREGMESGFPDTFFPVPRCGYSGIYIELKMPGARLREDQAFRIWMLRRMGFCAVVRYTDNDVISTLVDYLLNNGVFDPDHILEHEKYRAPKRKKNASKRPYAPDIRKSPLFRHWQFGKQGNV